MSSVVHYEDGGMKVCFFSYTTGIDCVVLRIYVSKIPSSRSASSPKVEQKFAFLSPRVRSLGKASIVQVAI